MFFLKFMSAVTGIILGFFLYDFIRSIPKKNKIKKYDQAYLFLKNSENILLGLVEELIVYLMYVTGDKNLSREEKEYETEKVMNISESLTESIKFIKKDDYIEKILEIIDKNGFENSLSSLITEETAIKVQEIRKKLEAYKSSLA